jgi:Transposase DDE domain
VLGFWRSHDDYQKFVVSELTELARVNPSALFEYETEISKLYILNLDELKNIIFSLYSFTGRPSNFQPEIFRSFILMNHLGFKFDKWLSKLKKNFVLRTICGLTLNDLPAVASYYDFMNRIIKLDERPCFKRKKRKPSKKIGKGKKLPPKRPNIVARLVDKILQGRRLNNRPEHILQKIFADVCVKQSLHLGLINQTISISGDGTCIRTGASHFGVRTCECSKSGNYHCDCSRRFSDPNATWGWDSHNDQWFYGYTGYFISTHNKTLKLDLPLYLRLVDAKRHDSISAVVALAEFIDLYPNLSIEAFMSDSASDNYATYEMLNHFDIDAVIALNSTNKGKAKYPTHLSIDENGVPICPGGNKMIYHGFCGKDRCRSKWRCPRVLGKAPARTACENCSKSNYGRVIYTKPSWDLRFFTTIPRGSERWKLKMNERTAAERVNNRILNNYGIENTTARGKKRISFFTTLAGFNIHLDAQLAKLKSDKLFDFNTVFGIKQVA